MYWLPKTKIGKISFYVGIGAFALMFLNYWTSMAFPGVGPAFILPGFLAMFCILASGVIAVLAIFKHKDHAILLALPVLIGLFGLFFVVGEFLFPH